jgi:hypothetical protein
MTELTPDERALMSMELKARGFALVWDQLDRSGIPPQPSAKARRRPRAARSRAGRPAGP